MMNTRSGIFNYVGIILMLVFLLAGCSSGGGSSSSSSDSTTSGTSSNADASSITMDRVAAPGELGSLVDVGDMVGAGDHWYYTKINAIGIDGSVVGATTRTGGPTRAAFKWDASSQTMTYLGIHGDAPASPSVYDDTASDPHPFIYSEGDAIGPTGDVICNSTTGYDNENRAFYWAAGTATDLPPLPNADPSKIGHYSKSFSISQDYVVLNREVKKNGNIIGYYWDKAGTAESDYGGLGHIVGASLVEPVGINKYNQAVINSGETTAVFHDLDLDVVQTLNHLPGASQTTASAINDSQPTGHIVGTSGDKGFFWDGGSMYPLGDLGGGTSSATALNNHDQVVGNSTTSSGETHAFLWALNASGQGVMTDLGTLGGKNSWATAINNNGLIVGYSETGDTYHQGDITQAIVHACAWYGNVIYDLGVHNDFYDYPFVEPYPFSEAVAVNDDNRIAGNSYTINSHYRGFIVDAVLP